MDKADAPIDIVALVAAAGTEGRALEYLALFQRQLPAQRAALAAALVASDDHGVSARAHEIAGMAAYCRAHPLQDAARTLQRAASSGDGGLQSAFDTLLNRIDELVALDPTVLVRTRPS